MTDEQTVTLPRSDWKSILTVLDIMTRKNRLEYSSDTGREIATLKEQINQQVA